MENLVLAELTNNEIRNAAQIFADEFSRAGLAGGETARPDRTGSVAAAQTQDMRERKNIKWHKERIKQAKSDIKSAKDTQKQHQKGSKEWQKAQQVRISGEKKLHNHNVKINKLRVAEMKEHWSGLGEESKRMTSNFFNATTAVALLTTAFAKAVNDFRSQIKFGAAGINPFELMTTSLMTGVDSEVLSQLQAQNKAAVVAMGGITEWSDALRANQYEVWKYTGDTEAAARITTETLQQLRVSGIQPAADSLQKVGVGGVSLVQRFAQIQKMGGQTFEEISAMMSEFTSMEEVRFRLMTTLDNRRREQIFQEIAQRHEMLMGLGMTAEQAKRAGEALEKMAAETPMERMKKAARLQAMGGAMGMGGQATEAAAIMRLGMRASPEQQRRLTQIVGQMQQQVAAARTGTIGGEFAMAAMMEKTGLGDMLGPQGPLSTALGQQFGPQQESAKYLKSIAEQFPILTETSFWAEVALKGIKDNPIAISVAGILAGVGTIATTVLGLFGLLKLGKIGNFFRRGGGGKGGGGPTPKAGKPHIKMKSGFVPTSAIDDVGMAAAKGGAMKAGGKALLKKIPLIGLGAGLMFAAERAIAGDFTGAGMEALSGAASMFPGLGTAASLGIDAALMARDVKQAGGTQAQQKQAQQTMSQTATVATNITTLADTAVKQLNELVSIKQNVEKTNELLRQTMVKMEDLERDRQDFIRRQNRGAPIFR